MEDELKKSPVQERETKEVGLALAPESSEPERPRLASQYVKKGIELLRRTSNFTKIGYWNWNPSSGEMTWTDEVYRIFGKNPKTFKPTLEENMKLVRPEDRAALEEAVMSAIKNRTQYDHEYRLTREDGSEIWCHGLGEAEYDDDGNVVSMHGIIQDVTQRKESERALRESEEKYRILLENSPDPIFSFKPDGTYIYVNEAFADGVGKSVCEIIGKKIWDVFPKDEADKRFAALSGVFKDGVQKAIEVRVPRPDGDRYYVTTITPIKNGDEIISAICSSKEITERKLAEFALKESEERVSRKLKALTEPEGDLGELKLADVLDADSLKLMMEEFYALTNIGSAIIDNDGKVLVAVGWQEICMKFHRVNPQSNANCIASDTILSLGAEPGRFASYKCKNNMRDMATPIMLGGKRAGNLFFGQFFYDDDVVDEDIFREQAKMYGFDEAEYMAALAKVPRWNKEYLDKAMSFYAKLAEVISSLSYNAIRLARALAEKDTLFESLKESEARFMQICMDAPNPLVIVAEDGEILLLNKVWEEITGYSNAEIPNIDRWTELAYGERKDAVKEGIEKLFQAAGRVEEGEFTIRTKSGERRVWDFSTAPLGAAKDGRKTIISQAKDVTDKKKTENELKKSEELFFKAFEGNPSFLTISSAATGKFIAVNAALENLTGYSKEELIGKSAAEINLWTDESLLSQLRRQTIETGSYSNKEIKIRTKSGSVKTGVASAQLIDFGGEKCILTSGLDLTDKKRIEEALRESEALYRAVSEHSNNAICIVDENARITWVNPQMSVVSGYPAARLAQSESFVEFLAPESVEFVVGNFMKFVAGEPYEKSYKFYFIRSDGSKRLLQKYMTDYVDRNGARNLIISMTDITEAEAAEKFLKESERKFAALFKASPLAVILTRASDNVFLEANEAFKRTLGYSSEELTGKTYNLFGLFKDESFKNKLIDEFMKKGRVEDAEGELIAKSGETIDCLVSVEPATFNGELYYISTITDITARKNAELALRESEEHFRAIFEGNSAAISIMDFDGTITMVNDAYLAVSGYSRDEVIGMNWRAQIPPDDLKRLEDYNLARLSGDPKAPEKYEFKFYRRDGGVRHAQMTVSMIPLRRKIVASFIDITERKRAEEERASMEAQLRHHQKLEAIGTLASGVAHEINNPLNIIMNYTQLIQDELPAGSASHQWAANIISESSRVANIVKNLLAFSRQEKLEKSYCSISAIVNDTLSLIAAMARKEQIKIVVDIPDNLPGIICHPQQIQQVLLNLLTNARDSLNQKYPDFHEDKTLRITGSLINKDGRPFIRTVVEDRGLGVPEKIKSRLFDPFFTTKPRDKGTGLGLSISHGIISEHGGSLSFESEEGKYSKFYFDLPV